LREVQPELDRISPRTAAHRADNTLHAVRILVTEAGSRLLEARRDRLDPDVEIFVVGDDHAVRDPGGSVVDADVAPEVAWITADTFSRPGAAARWTGLLDSASTLRLLQTPAAGYLSLYDPLLARGVQVAGARVNSIPIAEYVLRAVLDHFQRPGEWAAAQAQHAWRPHQYREVYGTTWLIVGLGAIGSAVAVRAAAFGAHVVGVRRTPAGDEPVAELLTPDQLLDALPRADVVLLSTPSTPETVGLVDATFLDAMRPESVLVNVARGSLVDEAALLAALDRGRPEVAILDAFATEPLPPEHPFWDHPRVVVTPHTSAGGLARHGRGADVFLENLARFRRGDALLHEVLPDHADPTGTVIDLVPRDPPART
jgi:phosphoglycerate dehydrogenase-like enzyme